MYISSVVWKVNNTIEKTASKLTFIDVQNTIFLTVYLYLLPTSIFTVPKPMNDTSRNFIFLLKNVSWKSQNYICKLFNSAKFSHDATKNVLIEYIFYILNLLLKSLGVFLWITHKKKLSTK